MENNTVIRNLLFVFIVSLGSTVCSVANGQPKSGIDPKGFDRSVRIQDDLFMHVNGEWLRHTPIPDDKSNYGSFTILSDEAQARIREIIEQAANGAAEESREAQKIGDFYRSYMNEELIEQCGLGSLKDELSKIDGLASIKDVVRHAGYLQTMGVGSPIGFYVDQDDKDSSQYLAVVIQSGTTLPDRDYYLKDDPKYRQAREALKEYITRLFELSGLPGAEEAGSTILDLETKLAGVQWERTELRNAEKRYNKFQVGQLAELTPQITWPAFFAAVDVPQLTEINVATPSFFQGLERILAETPLSTWQQYLRFNVLDNYAPVLPTQYADLHFRLHQKELAGVPQQKPRWKRAVDTVSGAGTGFGALGDAVGKLYVERHFSPTAKARMDVLVDNLLKAYEASIRELTWMTPATKERALEKLAKITTKIGYTRKWRDYSGLEIRPDDLIGNVMRSAEVEHRRMIDRLGKPVDREEWTMTPQTVNAYYNPGLNEIVFPAAILQPPFFDDQADDASNYGGIGAVIGHEISHAFDDQGSKYDGDGNLKNWWTDEDRDAFTRLTGRLVDQYSKYSPLPGKSVNGQLTLGENIADLSGMSIAYKAYHLSLAGKEAPVIDGWTGDQRFFLGWGQIWRRKYRDAEMVNRLLVDPHSPSAYRANGPLTNLDAFYSAFSLKPGDKLYKPEAERIRIW
jgi:predicted metalloendopeptidase